MIASPPLPASGRPPLLEARGLGKRFPGVQALRDVQFDLRPGEIHALCGENGAGKSTLIKLLSGIHPHGTYEGELRIEGVPAAFRGVRDAEAAGIAVITQELALVGELSVAENLFLGREPRRGWRIDWSELHRRAAGLMTGFGLDIATTARVSSLGIGQRQLVEIARAMDKRTRVLVLDEPTAALTGREVQVLLAQLRRLRAEGTACIYISHRLDEVLSLADRITVLRDGASVATLEARTAGEAGLIRAMVGREITQVYPPRADKGGAPGKVLLSVEDLAVADTQGGPCRLEGISLEVRAGEVLGIGGLMGAGRTELLMHLFGAWGERRRGRVLLGGSTYPEPSPGKSIARGLALVGEDRRRQGLVPGQGVGFNLSLARLQAFTGPAGWLDQRAEEAENLRWYDALGVRAAGLRTPAGTLSGGNQQKVVLGKALMTGPSVVFLDEPTRGIDIGAKVEIYHLIRRLAAEGRAVVLVSSELPELTGLSDRIVMLSGGRIGGVFDEAPFEAEALLVAAMTRPENAA